MMLFIMLFVLGSVCLDSGGLGLLIVYCIL